MKIIYLITFCMVFTLMSCKKSINGPEADVGKNMNKNLLASTADVEKAIVKFNNAMVNADSIQLVDLVSNELTYGHSSGLVQNKREFIDDVIHGPFNFSMIQNPDQSIHMVGGTAIVRHVFEAKATNEGKTVDIRIGNMQVYQKSQDGDWKLLARQAFKLK
ncbi:nuclear transport factor 2 family protein [Flagellimonas iocasae]|uniref:Nuclear transport factor 2 family protein n=1 Tax=Flagellimonas iocasae TaxID=2055905 RepID=A0ABW4XW65_9FLAO